MPPALPRSGSIEKRWEIFALRSVREFCLSCTKTFLSILPWNQVGGKKLQESGWWIGGCLLSVERGFWECRVLRMLLRRAFREGGRGKYDRNCSWNVYSAHRRGLMVIVIELHNRLVRNGNLTFQMKIV